MSANIIQILIKEFDINCNYVKEKFKESGFLVKETDEDCFTLETPQNILDP